MSWVEILKSASSTIRKLFSKKHQNVEHNKVEGSMVIVGGDISGNLTIDGKTITTTTKTRFDEYVDKMAAYAILKDQDNPDDIEPIVSYGVSKDLQITRSEDSFEMKFCIGDSSVLGKSEFVMAAIKYLPSEDMRVFWKNNYCLEFDVRFSPGVRAIQLEIKDEHLKKIVDKKINTQTRHKFLLPILSRNENAWKSVCEICFIVFLNENYLSETSSSLTISNLALTPTTTN